MKPLKRITFIATLLMLVAGITVQAQDKGKKGADNAQKDKKVKVEQRADAVSDSLKEGQENAKQKAKDNKGQQASDNKGNAYGKNKGEMSGREFGQARAAAARNLQTQIDSLEQKVKRGEMVANQARENLEEAEEALEENQGSEEVDSERRERIEKAKAQLGELEVLIQSEKARLDQAREKLRDITRGQTDILPSDSTDTDSQDSLEEEEVESEDEEGEEGSDEDAQA